MGEKMTLDGAVNKTGILLALCFSGAFIGWNIPALIWPGAIVGFILAMVTIFRNPAKAGSTAPLYALAQGTFLGGITLMYESAFDRYSNSSNWLNFWNTCFTINVL